MSRRGRDEAERPDVDRILAGLKDFQRRTVDYAFARLWGDEDQTRRFLVADEVGLGKTMVAKGVIARAVDLLWENDDRIDIVYICSNNQIARQNLNRLNVVGATELKHADRLTLLPRVLRSLQDQKVNFVSFTPGTSFHLGRSSGAYAERVLLYWMLVAAWGTEVSRSARWKKFFEGDMRRDRFQRELAAFDRSILDKELCLSFGADIDRSTGPRGGPLGDELRACAAEFNYLRGKPSKQLGRHRNQLIGRLRALVARAAVDHLEPDLVILDEFQRFKDLLDADGDGALLASEIFQHSNARVLMLSATPYKMYTLPDEPEGDDHYRDFIRTVRFLAGDQRARGVERDLRTMRETLLIGGNPEGARAARDRVEHELRRVMCRTERLAATPDRDGMLEERQLGDIALTAEDLRSWRTFDSVARQLHARDVLEYWRSTPYPLNLMDRHHYQVRELFHQAAERNDPDLAATLATAHGLLDWQDILAYRRIDPGNAKLRGLMADVLGRGTWRIAWLPPSMPYYDLGGAYNEPGIGSFTKRLVFSAWAVVPKAIALMMSYEAERLTHQASGHARRRYNDRPTTPPLQFRMKDGRPAGMPALALLYPSLVLAREGDPLAVARSSGGAPVARSTLLATVKQRLRDRLAELGPASSGDRPDQRWYWAAPLLLDRRLAAQEHEPLRPKMLCWHTLDEQERESALATHLRVADEVTNLDLGAQPHDLLDVLTVLAVAGPGVCSLRALSRVADGPAALADPAVRSAAFRIGQGMRSLFNKPEIIPLLRSQDDEAYWRSVLEHSLDGCLQAVLDEYCHVLVESEGLQGRDRGALADQLAGAIREALAIRSAPSVVEDVQVADGQIQLGEHRVTSHFAARYGRVQASDESVIRESTIRAAFNSPFRPFVLASTSVGQEGLDFHTYCHAIVHWNLPGNPVDLEQREGRVHRYKGHAIRKNVAAVYGADALATGAADPWEAIFAAAQGQRAGDSDINPFWVFATPDGAKIERYVPMLPLSREIPRYQRLQRTVGAYRLVIGQPRQDDLIRYVGDDPEWLHIDLTPPATTS